MFTKCASIYFQVVGIRKHMYKYFCLVLNTHIRKNVIPITYNTINVQKHVLLKTIGVLSIFQLRVGSFVLGVFSPCFFFLGCPGGGCFFCFFFFFFGGGGVLTPYKQVVFFHNCMYTCIVRLFSSFIGAVCVGAGAGAYIPTTQAGM